MLQIATWTVSVVSVVALMWQAAAAEPLLPRAVTAVLIFIAAFLAGLRIGTDSAAAYIRDLQRLNKVMAEQQRDLEDVNATLLKHVNLTSQEPSERA